jgi:prepilin-type N-terminal cleavage/methylation domain-containing protein
MAWRRGFSLLEIILVLMVLGIITALAVPSLNAVFSDYELRQAADRLRSRLVRARERAVERRIPYAFLYVPGTGQHGYAACASSVDPSSVSSGFVSADQLNPSDVQLFAFEEGYQLLPPEDPKVLALLPSAAEPSLAEDVSWLVLSSEEQLIARYGSPLLAEAIRATGTGLSGQAQGTVFYPDGTGHDFRVALLHPGGRMAMIEVSGPTGTVRVSLLDGMARAADQSRRFSAPRLPQYDRRLP